MVIIKWIQTANRKKLLIVGLLLIAIAMWVCYVVQSPIPETKTKSQSGWFESASTGNMTQEMSFFAVSKRTGPTLQMQYPYNRITASVGFGCHQSDEWIYVAFSEPPNIANAETEEELNRFISKIRFDQTTDEYVTTQQFGARFVQFKDDDLLITRLLESSSMTFEVDWYREGRVRFNFPLTGSTEVIEKTRNKCAGI